MEPYKLIDVLRMHAQMRPHHDAIVSGHRTISYVELLQRVEHTASSLRTRGINEGDTVGVTIREEDQHLVATLSLMVLGASQVLLPSQEPVAVHREIAKDVGVTHHLGDDAAILLSGVEQTVWSTPFLEPKRTHTAATVSGPGGKLFLRTSGTTGRAKVVVFSQQQLALQAKQHAEYADERLLRLATLEYNASKRHRLYCVWTGGTNVFRVSSPDRLVAYCLEQRVTSIDVSRVHVSDMVALPNVHRLNTVKIRPGGGFLPKALRHALMERVSPNLYIRYATTESGPIAMGIPADDHENEHAGRIVGGVSVEIVDEEGCSVPNGEIGEIRLKAPGMATGYFDDPEQTAMRFRNGWFYPGDVGSMDQNTGDLIVKGRKDDMINLNGIKIFPIEIENVLEKHADVSEASVFAVDSQVHGQIPVAAVVPTDAGNFEPKALRTYCKNSLGLRMPRAFLVLDTLPRNLQGKVRKEKLKAVFYQKNTKH